jgi:protein SYS1
MTFGGMWACQYRELQPITFGLGAGSGGGTSDPTLPLTAENEDLESGTSGTHGEAAAGQDPSTPWFSRGRGRKRNRDDFEMTTVKSSDGSDSAAVVTPSSSDDVR